MMKNMWNTGPSTLLLLALAGGVRMCAQQGTPQQIVENAVKVELDADRNDHSAWMYRDHDVTPDHDTVYLVAESPQGQAKRKLEDHGQALSPEQAQAENARLLAFIHDSNRLQKQRHDEKHDDDQADAMLKLLPKAFIWNIKSEQGELTTLSFRPNPNFSPDSIPAKVLSAMAGEIVVSRPQNRIKLIRGSLVNDVTLFGGLFMRLHKGGSFNVERREVGPGHWQITDSHVHIDGHALFFKTIGEQEDEIKTDFRPSTAQTVADAAALVMESALSARP